jgi:dihydrolipoamide dehydrogenase
MNSKAKKIMYSVDNQEAELVADIVILATGRKPYIEGLGLDKIGITIKRGRVLVNECQQTNISSVYAIGDVSGVFQLAHTAMAEADVAVINALGGNKKMDYSAIPLCVYTEPEIACIGLTDMEAKERGIETITGSFPWTANGRALTMNEADGFVKILAAQDNHRILGASIVGPNATELISELSLAIHKHLRLEDIVDTIHPHPTLSEAVYEAANNALGRCVNLPARGR